jgi:hypothetical protein
MELELVLNELAMSVPATNVFNARDSMTRFIQAVTRACSLGVNRVLRTHADFLSTSLAPNYSVGHWSHDRQVDLDTRRYFSRLTTKAPYTDGLPSLADVLLSNDYLFEGRSANGLGVAALIEGLAVSIDVADQWDIPSVPLVRTWVAAHGDGEIQTSEETVPHASRIGHLENHLGWIENRIKTSIRDGADMWQRRAVLFPALRFCDCVRDQLLSLTKTHVMLRPTVRRLFELDRYCQSWVDGAFNPNLIPCKITPESQAMLDEHWQELTFTCPDGEARLFSWHARMTPDAWRLHFFPDSGTRTIIIGRVGRKPFI